MITPVNDNFLIEPIMRTAAQTEELRKRASKSGLIIPEAKTDNRETFEGIPNQGYIRYLPESYSGDMKAGTRIIFAVEKPQGFKFQDENLIPVKQSEIVAIIPEVE